MNVGCDDPIIKSCETKFCSLDLLILTHITSQF